MKEQFSEMLETRKRILRIIQKKPGIHFRKIQRESGRVIGELEYHLSVLEKAEVVTKTVDSYHTRYYPSDELNHEEKRIMGLLRQEMPREILLYIITEEGIGHKGVTERFHLRKSTSSFYLDKLLSEGIIEKNKSGRTVTYSVNDPQVILRLILLYREGFGDRIAKMVEGLWANL